MMVASTFMKIDNYTRAVPVVCTADVAGTVTYFEETLGFEQQWIWGDPPVYAGLEAGSVQIYVTLDPGMAAAIREQELGPDIFLWVKDIDAVFEKHKAAGAEIFEALSERPWGVRQYVIREPNGYLLKVAEPND